MASGPLRLTLLVLLLVLSGCIGADPPASAADGGADEAADPVEPASGAAEAGDPARLDWTLSSCRVALALVPTDGASIEAHIPAGFQAASAQEAFGLPPDPRGEAALGVEAFRCEEGSAPGGPVSPMAYGAVFAAVEPPDDADTPDVDLVLYKWSTLVPDDERRTRLQEAGMPAVDGATDLSGLHPTPAGHAFQASLTLGGATHALEGTVEAPAQDFREGLPFVEFQAGDDGIGRWVSLTNEAPDAFQGSGALHPAGGTMVADVLGEGPSPAYVVAATTVDFQEGYVEFPGSS